VLLLAFSELTAAKHQSLGSHFFFKKEAIPLAAAPSADIAFIFYFKIIYYKMGYQGKTKINDATNASRFYC
jgi:hypothetical protein